MAVAGVEQQKIIRAQVVLPVFAAEGALAVLDQAQHIVRMEVVREGLHDARKAVGFQMQLCIVHHSAQFVGGSRCSHFLPNAIVPPRRPDVL